MTVQLTKQWKDSALLRYKMPSHITGVDGEYSFLAKCGIYNLMTVSHPSLKELYKIRYNEHGGLQLNDYQKILKKRLTALMWSVKDKTDLQIHIIIPPYSGNYFSFCVMISSLQTIPNSTQQEKRLFRNYNSFAVQHSDLTTLHLDTMKSDEIKNLFRISCTENNNGDLHFQLSVDAVGIPPVLFEENRVELGIHEIEVLQTIINFQVKHYDLPLIQQSPRIARSIGWDMNDKLISIPEPKRMATFGNERILVQALMILQSFHLRHRVKLDENIDPGDGRRLAEQKIELVNNHSYFLFSAKGGSLLRSITSLQLQQKYKKILPIYHHRLDELGLDLIQLFHDHRDILIEVIRAWVNIVTSTKGASYEMQQLLELFDDTFKTYGPEQLNEFQLNLFLKESTFDDLAHPELYNTLISKYAPIFSHVFFNYKEKLEIGATSTRRKLWKKDIFSAGIHVIDTQDCSQTEQLAIQSFFLILQQSHYFKDVNKIQSWTFHAFGEGLRHSFEKIEQVLRNINMTQSLVHFTHATTLPSILRSHELMLFDSDFSTHRILKSFGAQIMFEESGDSSLLVFEQVDTTLLKPIEPRMLDLFYDRNVLVKLPPDLVLYPHDEFPAKLMEEFADQSTKSNREAFQDIRTDEAVGEGMFSQPFVEEEDRIVEEYEEDEHIGPDLLFKLPVLASFTSYRNYALQDIEYRSNLPRDIVDKQLQELLRRRWIERVVKDETDFYLPLSDGTKYVEGFKKQIPEITAVQEEILELLDSQMGESTKGEKVIDEQNVLDALLALRMAYHSETEFDTRKDLLLKFCSLCKYVADTFTEFDELLAYFYWSIGVYAAFLETKLTSKREEHLLILKIANITKFISDIISEKLDMDFSTEQMEADSDEGFIFEQEIQEGEQDSDIEKVDALSVDVSPTETKERVNRASDPINQSPSVLNIPQATIKVASYDRQLTPQELMPIEFDPMFGPWFRFHRVYYDLPVIRDPISLTADDIIFTFMVNTMSHRVGESFDIKKDMRTMMFLNEQQFNETVLRSPLPLQVSYDNLIDSSILTKIDLGYTISDIRSIVPDPNVNIDPMHKRMSLDEITEVIDENRHNFIHSQMLQSYVYADFYDLELQPVVAICYAMLVDKSSSQQKIEKFSKFIPWVYSIIKMYLLTKRTIMRSSELSFLHSEFTEHMQKIHIRSSLELLEYNGDDDLAIKLQFLLRRKLIRMGVEKYDLSIRKAHITPDMEMGKEERDQSSEEKASKRTRRKRPEFSSTLIQQLETEDLHEEALEQKNNRSNSQSNNQPDIQIPENEQIETLIENGTEPVIREIKIIPTFKPLAMPQKVTQLSLEEEMESFLPSETTDTEIKFEKSTLLKINRYCEEVVLKAESVSPTDLLISLFENIIYPAIISFVPTINGLQLIELFNEVGELTGVSNTVDFSRNLGDMQSRWDEFEDTRVRVIQSFVTRLHETSNNFVYNELFRNLLGSKMKRIG